MGILFLVMLGLLARFLWHRHLYAVTNAVFVETDALVLASFDKVDGRLVKLFKKEGEAVSAGEPLAALDETTYALRVKTLKENLAALRRKAEALRIEIRRLTREIALREAQAGHEIERLSAERQAVEEEARALSAELAQSDRCVARGALQEEESIIVQSVLRAKHVFNVSRRRPPWPCFPHWCSNVSKENLFPP